MPIQVSVLKVFSQNFITSSFHYERSESPRSEIGARSGSCKDISELAVGTSPAVKAVSVPFMHIFRGIGPPLHPMESSSIPVSRSDSF